jgi:hypothetical protein
MPCTSAINGMVEYGLIQLAASVMTCRCTESVHEPAKDDELLPSSASPPPQPSAAHSAEQDSIASNTHTLNAPNAPPYQAIVHLMACNPCSMSKAPRPSATSPRSRTPWRVQSRRASLRSAATGRALRSCVGRSLDLDTPSSKSGHSTVMRVQSQAQQQEPGPAAHQSPRSY